MEWTLIVESALGVVSILLGINAFFVVRLVKSIDTANERSENLERQIAVINEKVNQLPDMYQRLVTLEKQAAIMEYIIKSHDNKTS